MVCAPSNQKVIQYKKLWQIVSGIHYATPTETVREELNAIKTELLNGIKSGTTTEANSLSSKLDDCPDTLLPFIEKLKHYLDVDKQQTWNIFCCYLQNEYNDSLQLLMNFLKNETNTVKLLEHIWDYHALERMTLLKIIKNLLELCKSAKNPYATAYDEILAEIGLGKLRKSYIEQFAQLVKEPAPFKFAHGELFNVNNKLVSWTERKLRETNEILQILLLIVERDNIRVNEFKTLIELFKLHSFGRQQSYLDLSGNSLHRDLVTKITYSEVALFLKCIDTNSGNLQWLSDVSTTLDKDIVLLHQNPEHGPILLAWMLMNFHLIELSVENAEFRKYQQYGTKAVKLGVFSYLQTMLSHPMYRDQSLAASITCKTIFNMLSFLCDIFDSDRAVAQHKHIYELLCELLRSPHIAKEFCTNTESGAQSLLNTAIESFPIDFVPLSMIAHSLTTTSIASSKYIRDKLEGLPVYTEYYNSQRMNLKQSEYSDGEYILLQDFLPFSQKIGYTIPAGTVAVITDKPKGPQVHFKTMLNYFSALHHEIDELLFDLIKRPEVDPQRKQRIYWGLKYLASAVRRINDPREISSEMVHPTEMVFDLLLKFKDVPNPPVDLLAQCFDVCAALVPMHQTEIYKRVINLNILPFCTTDKLKFDEYANGSGFDTGLVGYYLVSFEKACGRYEFLSAYLSFLKIFAESNLECTVSLELPGLIFLLREVFPYIHTWRFENESDRQQITAQILQYFCYALKISEESSERLILRSTCVYSLLHLDSGMTLLRIVALGNSYIEEVMQHETNWMTAEKTNFNFLVQLSMTILMHILRLRSKLFEKNASLSPLETVIYTQPKNVIPVVTGYMRNIFNRRLPILSCRLLRRFAIEFQMSLLACLDMEPSQIRSTFLERLENELECDELKIGVLEFVEACIEKQPGMTEAFFKINYDDRKVIKTSDEAAKNKDLGEGILTYMKLYLTVVGENANAVAENPKEEVSLLMQIMSLFHALWKNNMQTLVEKLLSEKNFWAWILNPLFGHVQSQIRVYAQLFNMIGLELYRLSEAKNMNENLKTTLNRFLNKNVFFDWVDNVLAIPDSMDIITDDTPEWLCRLQSFKDLFVIILRRKNRHGIEVPKESVEYFADQCLRRLVERIHYTDDMRPFIVLSELYLTLLFSCPHHFEKTTLDYRTVLPQINLLMNQLAIAYGEIHIRAKESILAVAFKAIDLFGNGLNASPKITLNFVESTIHILCLELMETEIKLKAKAKSVTSDGIQSESKSLPFILCLNILKAILHHSNEDANGSSIEGQLQRERVFNRILSCLNVTVQVRSARKLTCELLDMLIVLAADEKLSSQLLYCDLDDYLWLKLLPPKELLQTTCGVPVTATNSTGNSITWQSNEWWPIYSRGIQLVHNLLHHHGPLFAKKAIAFVGVHEEFLIDSILLAKHALSETPLKLIKNTLELVSALIQYEKEWRLEHQQSMINLMRCVQVLLDHTVSLLYRPKHLKRLIKGTGNVSQTMLQNTTTTDDEDSGEDELRTMNALIEIVTICSKCLMAFSPTLMDLLANTEFVPAKWQPLIEIQFNAPKLNVGATFPQLTFGTVLNAAVIFTKALSLQQFTFNEIPLNEIEELDRNNDESAANPTLGDTLATSRVNRRRNYTTSISALSTISATVAASNEHLVNLDSELCLNALEFVLTLLASQSLLALKDENLSQREKQLIRRELSTELSVFHDFVKKRILPEATRDEPLHRKKHGIVQMTSCNYQKIISAEEATNRGVIGKSDQMRVNVMRKLHLKNQPSPTVATASTRITSPFNMTEQYSPISAFSSHTSSREQIASGSGIISGRKPIGSMSAHRDLPSSTPTVQPLKSCLKAEQVATMRISGETYRIDQEDDTNYDNINYEYCGIDDDDDNEEQIFFEPDEPVFSELSFVRLVEEDYLHLMSNLFGYICHTEKIN